MDDQDDSSFLALSARLRDRIDGAFDSVVQPGTQSKPAGGFIVEESGPGSSQFEAGGFIIEDLPTRWTHIPLVEIPRALNLLDLSPDEDIMGVFRNAATGWGTQNACDDGISRKDWRAICAALLEGDCVDRRDEENSVEDEDVEMGHDSCLDSDEYQMERLSGDSDAGETSSDEYEEPNRGARARKVTKTPPRIPMKSSARPLTESQRAQCRREFSRFFPDVPDDDLDHRRIMIKDVARVADLLKESLKTEEILEMLEAFSTLPDKSMNLADFENMMVLTKLV